MVGQFNSDRGVASDIDLWSKDHWYARFVGKYPNLVWGSQAVVGLVQGNQAMERITTPLTVTCPSS